MSRCPHCEHGDSRYTHVCNPAAMTLTFTPEPPAPTDAPELPDGLRWDAARGGVEIGLRLVTGKAALVDALRECRAELEQMSKLAADGNDALVQYEKDLASTRAELATARERNAAERIEANESKVRQWEYCRRLQEEIDGYRGCDAKVYDQLAEARERIAELESEAKDDEQELEQWSTRSGLSEARARDAETALRDLRDYLTELHRRYNIPTEVMVSRNV